MWKFKSSILEAILLSFLQTSSSLFPTSLPVSLSFLSGSFLLSQLHSVSSGVNFTHWACLFNNLFIPFLIFLFGFLSFTAILASSDPHPPHFLLLADPLWGPQPCFLPIFVSSLTVLVCSGLHLCLVICWLILFPVFHCNTFLVMREELSHLPAGMNPQAHLHTASVSNHDFTEEEIWPITEIS